MADDVTQFSTTVAVNADQAKSRACCSSIDEYYEIERCVRYIGREKFTKVALQFPDWQLSDAPLVAKRIEEQCKCKTYILADTSYGSCCVDGITAEHVKADLIIHFGPSCLSLTKQIPVLYIFGKEQIDINHCCKSFRDAFQDTESKVLIIYEVVYNHAIDEIYSYLLPDYKYLIRSYLNDQVPEQYCMKTSHVHSNMKNTDSDSCGSTQSFCDKNQKKNCDCSGIVHSQLTDQASVHIKYDDSQPGRYSRFGRTFTIVEGSSLEEYIVFYIGQETPTLINHMISYNKCQFFTYNPGDHVCHKETLSVSRLLMKRYYLIEKAKDACVVGILIGTLGIANYLSVINYMKEVIGQAGKKCYTFVVGKLNVAKLANFMEIDIFVLVGCPENSVIQSQDFYKLIVTPFEMEIACTAARHWTGDYITDFQELLPGTGSGDAEENVLSEKNDSPTVSLLTGQLRSISFAAASSTHTDDCSALMTRNNEIGLTKSHHTAGEFLEKRSWQGLEPRQGVTAINKVVQGNSGIAVHYLHESH